MTTKTGTESKNPIIPNKLPPSTSAKITQNELIPKLFPETLGDITFGKSDEDNVEIRKFLEPKKFDFEVKAHWDLGVDLDILDFERAVKISGSRFSVFKGLVTGTSAVGAKNKSFEGT